MRASRWHLDEGRWVRTEVLPMPPASEKDALAERARTLSTRLDEASGESVPYVVAQATDHGWYVVRVHGTGGMTGSAGSVEAARSRVDRVLLRDGWELEF